MSRRAPLTDRINVYPAIDGLQGPVPAITNLPCRLVEQLRITPNAPIFARRVCWLTMDQLDLFTGTSVAGHNTVVFDFNSADFVEVTTRGGIILRPIISETITGDTMLIYHRYWCSLENDMDSSTPGIP
jgi:hypothetical protein